MCREPVLRLPNEDVLLVQVFMRKIAIAALSFLAFVAYSRPVAAADETVIEEIIARINGQIITRSDFRREIELLHQELKQADPERADQLLAERQKDILRNLIDRQLLVDKGEDLGINVDADVLKRLDEMRKQMGLETMEDLEKAAASQGVSLEDLKQKIKRDMISYQVIGQEVVPHVTVTREEMQKYYDDHKSEIERPEQVRLSEILIADGENGAGSIEAAQQKAAGIIESLKKGEKFEDLAKAQSNGPTAANGGDLGYFKRGVLAKQLEDQVFPLKGGEYTQPIRTKQGMVIIKVVEHIAGGIPSFSELEPQIRQGLLLQKVDPNAPAMRNYLTKLREDAYIDIKPGYLDTAASPNSTKPVYTTATSRVDEKEKKKKKRFILF